MSCIIPKTSFSKDLIAKLLVAIDLKYNFYISSVFYVFYDQYLTIWRDLIVNLSLSFTAVFLVTCILLGFDIHTSLIIILCVLMIIIDMFGVMYLWDIQLNAISVVNIIMVRYMYNIVTHTSMRNF
jgi:hypothetical protein